MRRDGRRAGRCAWGRRLGVLLAVGVIASGCEGSSPRPRDEGPAAQAAERAEQQPTRAADRAHPRVVVLGDSLTAGLGLPPEAAFPALLQARLAREGYDFEVLNAGVSGDTTAGGLRRLDWALDGDVRVLIVALGGNDGLRGLPVAEIKRNLDAIIRRARTRGIRVVLAGMEAPPNFGEEYTRGFRQVFRDLAREHRVAFLPFLLQDVAGHPALNQPDGIHPNAAGARIVAEHVWRVLKPLLDEERTARR